MSPGASGVLFVGLLFGHFGINLPKEVQQLGIALFVYAIGIQGGSRFFNQFKKRGILFAKIGIAVIATGAFFTWMITILFGVDPALALGMYAGAMTSTPALGAITEMSDRNEGVMAYTGVYPVALILMAVVRQFLVYLL
ncbi:MAG: hypothetical protein JXR49_14985 [Acidobacteria bacterium]|nr:hypothetical protein [Acidobacteriota bacterium]